jgi:uncharacterized coiled-coil DUF342 family protein
VKEIELQIKGYKKIDKKHQKIQGLLVQRKAIDDQADVFHKELTDLAKKSQELHATMMEKLNVVKKDRAEADSLHQAFVKAKEQNDLWYAQVGMLIGQSRSIRTTLREQTQSRRAEEEAKRSEEQSRRKEEQSQRAVKEKEIKEKIGAEAKEKLQRGEKVNWEEFQFMLGDDEEDTSDTQA